METKTLAGILSVAVFLTIIELVRRGKLTFKYAAGWLLISLSAIFFAIFNQFLFRMAHWLGFELTSNFIFFAPLSFFVFLSILLTTFLCQQDIRNDTIAQKIGILEMELLQLKEQWAGKSGRGPSY